MNTMTHDKVLNTGFPELNEAIGIDGYPVGRVIEVFGPGARTMGHKAIVAVQSLSHVACLIDCGHSFCVDGTGISNEHLLVSQPDTVEQALDVALLLAKTGAVQLVVVDCLHAIAMANYDDEQLGLRARLMSQALRQLTAACYRSETTMIFAGPWTESASNNALRFYCSVRIKLDEPNAEGLTRAHVIKNKMACPFSTAMLDLGGAK